MFLGVGLWPAPPQRPASCLGLGSCDRFLSDHFSLKCGGRRALSCSPHRLSGRHINILRFQDSSLLAIRPFLAAIFRTPTQKACFAVFFPGAKEDSEVVPCQLLCPPCLPSVQDLRRRKQLEVVVVCDHVYLVSRAFEVSTSLLEAIDNGQQLFPVSTEQHSFDGLHILDACHISTY